MMGEKQNPNEYDDESFLKANVAIQQAVSEMWDAGGSADDIRAAVDNAIGGLDE